MFNRSVKVGLTGIVLINMMAYGFGLAAGPEVERGKKIFDEKRCSLCHAIGSKGGKKGPDLSDVGIKRDSDWLMKFLQDPKGTIPGAKMMPVKTTKEELSALIDYLLSLKK